MYLFPLLEKSPNKKFVPDEETDEFNIHIARYRPEELQKLASKTKFTRKEIQLMYRGFKQVSNF